MYAQHTGILYAENTAGNQRCHYRRGSYYRRSKYSLADLKIIKGIATEYVRDIFRRLRDHGYDENTMLLSPDLRAEERDLKELISDYHFLKENDIHTVSDLQANIYESKG